MLVEKVDKSYAGQLFEILLWVANVAAVVFIAIIGWLMSNLVDKVDALDTRTRAVEVSLAGLSQAPRDLVPPWLLARIDKLDADLSDVIRNGSQATRERFSDVILRIDRLERREHKDIAEGKEKP